MIINVRGTIGSGKTELVRRIMLRCRKRKPVWPKKKRGRRNPIGYILDDRLFVPGHYESSHGGCDNIKPVGYVYKLIRRHANCGFDVLYEGHTWQGQLKHMSTLFRHKIRVVLLETSLDDCLASARKRHRRGKSRWRMKTLKTVYARQQRACDAMGISVVRLKRNLALRYVANLLHSSRRQGGRSVICAAEAPSE